MSKHTPGPWGWNPATGFIKAPATKDFPHGQVIGSVSRGPGKNTNENARLIAAAPDLLEALSRILYAHDTKNCGAAMGEAVLCSYYAEMARAAIAKAKGETL